MSKLSILIIACLIIGKGYTQQISLSYRDAPIEDVFTTIEKQTGYTFFYKRSWLKKALPVNIEVKNAPLEEALDLLFKPQPLSYVIEDRIITIEPKRLTATAATPVFIKGVIVNESNEPVPGATISVKGSNKLFVADNDGAFVLSGVSPEAALVVSSVNYTTREMPLQGSTSVTIQLRKQVAELQQVAIVSTGYQNVAKANATGSFVKIDNDLYNRRVSGNVLDRLEGVTNGLLFNKNITPNTYQSNLSVRGRSTIYANAEPLIVLDNFPYTGDIENINPNDVESITVLKDAAAASIWGAYSGNGVIVITTKRGKYDQPVRLSFNTNLTIGEKPDLDYVPRLSSSDYIDVEQFLFSKGFYTPLENARRPLSPAVEILIAKRDGLITAADSVAQLNALRKSDIRNDLSKYFYRKSISQQYSVNGSGGGANNYYSFSAGFDKSLDNLQGNDYSRVTLSGNHTYSWLQRKLELTTGGIYTISNTRTNGAVNFNSNSYPYLELADADANALTVPADVRQPYKDTAGGGALLDWDDRPLDELGLSDNVTKLTDYRINLGLKYKIIPGLDANIIYQYSKGYSEQQVYQSQQTYYTRNLINRFTQISGGTVTRPVPLGGIFDDINNNYEANNTRGQLNYNHTWKGEHALSAMAGAEIRRTDGQFRSSRLYGYDKNLQTSTPVDYQSSFPLYYASTTDVIPNKPASRGTTNRFISYYVNATYTWKQRYIVYGSARKDEANIFGVKTNQKGVPLWSAGAAWIVNQEHFYQVRWLPYLKLRVTDGYNGNVDKSVSAFTTISVARQTNPYGMPAGTIVNPPNPALRWEKINMLNVGMDFAAKSNIITGSLDYYYRSGKDLIGISQVDPTTGVPSYKGNNASMRGQGIDITINTRNIDRKFKWYTIVLFNYTTDKVTDYNSKQNTIAPYLNSIFFNPLEGKPLYSIYSLKWAGLDSQNGDPQGYVDGHVSKDYNGIVNSNNFSTLQYIGPANPTLFGSLRNTFSWKQASLSFNITWKAGYYFRRPSINYNDLFTGGRGNPDYEQRWQTPGDEKITNVPSMRYPADGLRDAFYANSNILVEKGDHIRLQDIQLSYDILKQQIKNLPVHKVQVYMYANNLGILWRANDKGIDPDYISIASSPIANIPNPRTFAAGIKVEF